MQVPRGNPVKVEVVAEFLLEPAHWVPADVFKRALGEPLATMDVSLPADGPGDNVLPVVVLVAVVDAHLGVAEVARHAAEIVVESQVVDHRLEAGEVGQVTGQELGVVTARGWCHTLGDGIFAWAAALGHLQNSSRDTVAESNTVAVAVRGVVVADHADRVLALGD